MWTPPENDQFIGELFLAGERVPAGRYRQIGSGREVRLDEEDFLPASFDGRVACYMAVRSGWTEVNPPLLSPDDAREMIVLPELALH